MQCMRQFYEEGDINRAFNSLNYLSTITAMVFRTAFELKKGRSWKVLALVTSALAVLQNTYWDIVKDWGLLQRLSKNPYLRDKLILPHRSIYFIAMVTKKLTEKVRSSAYGSCIITLLIQSHVNLLKGCGHSS